MEGQGRHRLSRLLAVVGAGLLLACVAPAGGTATARSAGQASLPQVELLAAGRGPRQPLRFALEPGPESSKRLGTKLRIVQRLGSRSRTAVTPPVRITITTQVRAAQPDGSATVTFTYEDAEVADSGDVPKSRLDAAQAQLDAIEGTRGTLTVTPTGRVVSGGLAIAPDVDAQTRQLLEQFDEQLSQLSVPLPDDAVGVGARWKVVQRVALSGVRFRQTATYELRERDGNRVSLAVSVDQRADHQTIESTSGSAELLSSRGKGKGTNVLDLSQPLPARSALHQRTEQRVRADGQTINQTSTVDITLRPA